MRTIIYRLLFWGVFIVLHSQVAAQNDTLEYGTNLLVRLEGGDSMNYFFPGQRGDQISIQAAGDVPASDNRLELFDPDGQLVAQRDGQGQAKLRLDVVLRKIGMYTIRLKAASQVPQVYFGISLLKVNSPLIPPSLSGGERRVAVLEQLGQRDAYTFCGSPGDEVTIDLVSLSAALNTRMELYDPAGILMRQLPGKQIQIETILSEEGLFTIIVEDEAGTGTGSYELSLSSFGPCIVEEVRPVLCEGQIFIFNGELFDENRPSGITRRGDTLFKVRPQFQSQLLLQRVETLCMEDYIIVNGTRYDKDNPSGQELIEDTSSSGCDIVVQIDLSFREEIVYDLNRTLCAGESLEVNGVIYDAANPSGTEIIRGGAAGGCDSVVHVELDFYSPAAGELKQMLCAGESLEVNGVIYDAANPSGMEIIRGGATGGCDSVVYVELDFYAPAAGELKQTLCAGESLVVNGVIYDAANLSGTEIIRGGATGGCDSVVYVELDFYAPAVGELRQRLCAGESLEVNGVIYDAANPSGTENILGGAAGGCDSVVYVELDFYSPAAGELRQRLCTGESLEVNGVVYDAANPEGLEVIKGGAIGGCDSVVYVELDFFPEAAFEINELICPGEFIMVNGTVYDETNLNGEERLENAAASGCDSLIFITLSVDSECSVPEEFFIPSGITPNGDGKNDQFRIPALISSPEDFGNNELIILNRWGQLVYQATPYRNDWTGVNQYGEPLPAGTYFYSFSYGEGKFRQGEVTIIR